MHVCCNITIHLPVMSARIPVVGIFNSGTEEERERERERERESLSRFPESRLTANSDGSPMEQMNAWAWLQFASSHRKIMRPMGPLHMYVVIASHQQVVVSTANEDACIFD